MRTCASNATKTPFKTHHVHTQHVHTIDRRYISREYLTFHQSLSQQCQGANLLDLTTCLISSENVVKVTCIELTDMMPIACCRVSIRSDYSCPSLFKEPTNCYCVMRRDANCQVPRVPSVPSKQCNDTSLAQN